MTKHEFLRALEAAKSEEEFYKVICEAGYEPCDMDGLRIGLIDYVLDISDDRIYDYRKEEVESEEEGDSYCFWTFSEKIIKAAHDAIGDKDYRAPFDVDAY